MVQPAEALELERVRSKPTEVARAVQTRVRIFGEGITREPFGGEIVTAEVPEGHARAADANLADDADGCGFDANTPGTFGRTVTV